MPWDGEEGGGRGGGVLVRGERERGGRMGGRCEVGREGRREAGRVGGGGREGKGEREGEGEGEGV